MGLSSWFFVKDKRGRLLAAFFLLPYGTNEYKYLDG